MEAAMRAATTSVKEHGVKGRKVEEQRIIVALDFPDKGSCMEMLGKLDPALCRVKIGKELFTRYGPELVKQIQAEGFRIFLDLKFHDIPNTVAGAVRAAADLGVWMVNVHASGGRAMMEAAREAGLTNPDMKLIAVTVLTSLSSEDLLEIGFNGYPEQQVLRLARMTASCELDGVVCSAREIELLRNNIDRDFLLVTPGIRPQGDDVSDQKRVETPGRAIAKGADYLVIGRPVTQAVDPRLKLQDIMAEIAGKN
jgi:orotidine-5'-phosphate decarboxylase